MWVASILYNQFSQMIDVHGHFWNDETVRPGNDGCFERGETGITAKHAEKHRMTMRARDRTHEVNEFCRPADGGLKANTVVRTGHIVVHCFGNTPDGHPSAHELVSVTEGIISPDDDQTIELEKAQVL